MKTISYFILGSEEKELSDLRVDDVLMVKPLELSKYERAVILISTDAENYSWEIEVDDIQKIHIPHTFKGKVDAIAVIDDKGKVIEVNRL